MDSIKAYIKELRKIPLLTAEEEIELAKKIKKGDKKAQEKMIRSNLRLVINIAKRYIHFGVPIMDLIEEGNLGLMKAVKKFEHKRGLRFSTCAAWWIRQSIGRAISEQGKLIRVPVYMNDLQIKHNKTKETLTQKLRRPPNPGELAKAIGVTADKIKQLTTYSTKTSSLDAPVGEEGEDEVMDLIEDTTTKSPEDALSIEFNKERIAGLLHHMSDKERKILSLRFGLDKNSPHTLADIARKEKVSRERIRQIESVALKKLRKFARIQDKEMIL